MKVAACSMGRATKPMDGDHAINAFIGQGQLIRHPFNQLDELPTLPLDFCFQGKSSPEGLKSSSRSPLSFRTSAAALARLRCFSWA